MLPRHGLMVWILPLGADGASRIQQANHLWRSFLSKPLEEERWRPRGTASAVSVLSQLPLQKALHACGQTGLELVGQGTGGLTVGVTEEALHGVQVLAAQPGLIGLCGDGHQLGGGVFEEQVLLTVGLGAEHLEAAALMVEETLCVGERRGGWGGVASGEGSMPLPLKSACGSSGQAPPPTSSAHPQCTLPYHTEGPGLEWD